MLFFSDSNFLNLSERELNLVKKTIVFKDVKRGEVLLKENEIATSFYYVRKGCLRLFHGWDEEKTINLFLEDEFVISHESFFRKQPSQFHIDCVEDGEVVVCTKEGLDKIIREVPKLNSFLKDQLENNLIDCYQTITSFIVNSPEERYMNLLENKPEILRRVPNHYIASYLGVTPQSLSRIRKRIVKSKEVA